MTHHVRNILNPEQYHWHFVDRILFFKRKFVYLDWDFTEVCSLGYNWQDAIIGSGNGLVPPSIKPLLELMMTVTPYAYKSWKVWSHNIQVFIFFVLLGNFETLKYGHWNYFNFKTNDELLSMETLDIDKEIIFQNIVCQMSAILLRF